MNVLEKIVNGNSDSLKSSIGPVVATTTSMTCSSSPTEATVIVENLSSVEDQVATALNADNVDEAEAVSTAVDVSTKVEDSSAFF